MELTQIVPRLPPPEEGVGGIALALAAALAQRGISCRFVVPSPHGAAARRAGLHVVEVAREPAALAAALDGAERTILHYAGYGYHPRGVPGWLAEGLARTDGALWTQFHEMWATGPPWRSSFWLAPLQRRIAGSIGDRSERISTSLDLYARLLRRRLSEPRREIEIRPVISGIGEVAEPLPFERRTPRLVVFGGPGVRARAYGEHSTAIEASVRAFGLAEIWDIGPEAVAPPSLGALPIRRLGVLPAPEVSAILAESAAAFLAYPLGFLGKSSVFAAYAAHGALPICAGRPVAAAEGGPTAPRAGMHFWNASDPALPSSSDLASIAAAARTWYEGHSLARQAAAIADWADGSGATTR
ncbi:MAG TPA: glycosyltransferase family 1 protein [Thermoanaerobaculia bacterium]|nr:glycosyltransferase family 1 protein [Thermoanaerobaculia bacterium]